MTTAGPAAWMLVVLAVAIPSCHALTLMKRGRFLLVDPLNLFWIGFWVCYVLEALEFGEDIVDANGEGPFLAALAVVAVAEIFTIAGYESGLGPRVARAVPRFAPRLQVTRLAAVACAFICAGLLGYYLLMASAGGASSWLSVGRGGTDWQTTTAYVGVLEQLLPVGVLLALFAAEYATRRGLGRVVAWALAAGMWAWLLYLGSRSRLIVFTLTMLCAYFLPRRQRPPLIVGVSLVPLVLALSSFQAQYREGFTNLSLNLEDIDRDAALSRLLPSVGGRSAGAGASRPFSPGLELNCVVTIVRLVPATVDYNLGYGHLEILTRWIPRAIWPEKIYPSAETAYPILLEGALSTSWIQTSSKPLLMGPAFTFVGHWYAVGGVLAVGLAGLGTGALFRAMRCLVERSPGSQGDILLFTSILPIGFAEAVATPLGWIYSLPFAMAPLLLALRWASGNGAGERKTAPRWRVRR